MGAMCLIPGLPWFAFAMVSLGLLVAARRVAKEMPAAAVADAAAGSKKKQEQAPGAEMAALLRLEDLTLEIGFQLIPLVDEKQGGLLLQRVRTLRRHLSTEL